MNYCVRLKDVEQGRKEPYISYYLLGEKNGCVAGCRTGISIHSKTEWSTNEIHDDQEGFLVLEGTGWAKVGDSEFPIEPETAIMVPAGMVHALKRDPASKPIKVFWFHAAIK
ncbi:cupin domain-containing protein [Clostridium thailandense]|uniref:Cupin domain-containing protein n=1 Tax=Clostridium thailandense TaxID=2794346 RepID=A0A949TU26_9CLOT|nr:cupin domain-containing protein [Clostridium thailandense]MBV7273431.1 cupin domain-containing protein [Clostridium thailandense]